MVVSYNWLKEYLGADIPSPEKLAELLTFHAFEIESTESVGDDFIIDVKILPDRGADALSHRGIAREVATLIDRPLTHDPLQGETKLPTTTKLTLSIGDPKACRRFGAALVSGITIKDSPEWLQKRLRAIGQRPINNVVDATNYVMFSLGQPLHAYDVNKLTSQDGVRSLGTRFATEGETLTVLTGETFELDSSVQVIIDGNSGQGVGIAGIKGGAHAEIEEGTTSIILEAANFDPAITRRASQKLKLQTDASKRFENEPSRELVPHALREVVELITQIAGGTCEGYVDSYPAPYENPTVTVSQKEINALLGLSLTEEETQSLLSRLGFTTQREDNTFKVTAPFERTDIKIPVDVIEEVGRVYGYSHITAVVPEPVPLKEFSRRHYYGEKVRNLLVSEGYSEVITSSFRKKDEIELQNALASDKGCLRSSLRQNIEETLERNIFNIELLHIDAVRVFEIGTVFHKATEKNDIEEHVSLALGVRTKKQGHTPKDDEALKVMQEKLETTLEARIDATIQKGVFECNLTKVLAELPEPTAYEPVHTRDEITYRPYSAYPYISRDLAFWVPEGVTAQNVEALIVKYAGELLIQTALFDEFHKDGRVSYAFRLIFQSMERTLTDDEVHNAMESVEKALKSEGYEIR